MNLINKVNLGNAKTKMKSVFTKQGVASAIETVKNNPKTSAVTAVAVSAAVALASLGVVKNEPKNEQTDLEKIEIMFDDVHKTMNRNTTEEQNLFNELLDDIKDHQGECISVPKAK